MARLANTPAAADRTGVMSEAIDACIHCGFCLPTCPTYLTMGEETNSPRGRIVLMKEVLAGDLRLEDALAPIDNCLGCQACVTACPSGVEYGDLITSFRAHAEPRRNRPPLQRMQRALVLRVFPHPRRFRAAVRLGRLLRPVARHLPASLARPLALLPAQLPRASRLPAVYPAVGPRRARVALLAGCAQRVLEPDINWATLRVLAHNGVETVIPESQGCCGALAMHTGASDLALRAARRNLAAFPRDVDVVITNAAGCGSGMREYGVWFADAHDRAAAQEFADRVQDVSAFLAALGLSSRPRALGRDLKVAYQDACHLAHAQGVRAEPRALLAAIPGVELTEPDEWQVCCGSAGTYNIEHAAGAELGERKAQVLAGVDPDVIATGNIGCMTQLRVHLRRLGHEIPLLHTMQLLDRAYRRAI